MEQQSGSKLEKEYVRAVYCHPVYLTYISWTQRDGGLTEFWILNASHVYGGESSN